MKKYILAITAAIIVAGTITFVACNKDSSTNSLGETSIVASKGSFGTFDDAITALTYFYEACDYAYASDSMRFIQLCNKNEFENFFHFIDIDSLWLERMNYYFSTEWKEYDKWKYTPSDEGEFCCQNCDTAILPRFGMLVSNTHGHLAELIPGLLNSSDRDYFGYCSGFCHGLGSAKTTVILGICIGEYYMKSSTPFQLSFSIIDTVYSIQGRSNSDRFHVSIIKNGKTERHNFIYNDDNDISFYRINDDSVRMSFEPFSEDSIYFILTNFKRSGNHLNFSVCIKDGYNLPYSLSGSDEFLDAFFVSINSNSPKAAPSIVFPNGVARLVGSTALLRTPQEILPPLPWYSERARWCIEEMCRRSEECHYQNAMNIVTIRHNHLTHENCFFDCRNPLAPPPIF